MQIVVYPPQKFIRRNAYSRSHIERNRTPPKVDSFRSITGRGVVADMGGAAVLVGSPDFLTGEGINLADLAAGIAKVEQASRTVIAVAKNGQALGIVALGDTLRSDAIKTVAQIKKAGLQPILLTGDNEGAARRIAAGAGIDDVFAGVLPDGKAEIVRRLQQAGAKVAMVGDGINDAPALMQSDIGIAMGSGTDIAIESADIIVLADRLLELVVVPRDISRRGYHKMLQNVVLAFCFNGIGIPVAATGLIYPYGRWQRWPAALR